MKIAVIGGGGVRSLFLTKSIAMEAESLGISELVLMDHDEQKLSIFGSLAHDTAYLLNARLQCTLTTSVDEAVTDADYVITTIRVGGDDMRVADENIALAQGLLAQETTGVCGFSFAMRSIPALAKICAKVQQLAKSGAVIFNFTNPAGLVSQALHDLGYAFTYGICDAPTSLFSQIAAMLNVPNDQIQAKCYGLNHFSWFYDVERQGKNITDDLLRNPRLYLETDMKFFPPALVWEYNALFNEYLYYYFFRQEAVRNIKQAGTTRGRQIQQFNREMMQAFQNEKKQSFEKRLAIFEYFYGLREDSYMAAETGKKRSHPWRFDLHAPDKGGYAGVALNFMRIRNHGGEGRMILSLPNQGALPFLSADDVAEMSCLITPDAVIPDPAPEIRPVAAEMIRRMKWYEKAAIEAILRDDPHLAAEALQLHPLVESFSDAKAVAELFFRLNEPWRNKGKQ